MAFPVILLWIDCLLFLGFGVGFAAAPQQLADLVLGAAPSTTSALIDMRATYGGLAVGIGLFFGLCASRPQWVRPGVVASLLLIAGLGGARLIGIMADGDPNGFMLLFLALEVLLVVLSVAALRQAEPSLVSTRP
jgi:hypothetical protein